CRDLVRGGHRLYIIAGPSGRGGVGASAARETLAQGRIIVPAECWKVVVIVNDSGDDELAQVDAQARVIAIIMPNDENRVRGRFDWRSFRCSPAEIEE